METKKGKRLLRGRMVCTCTALLKNPFSLRTGAGNETFTKRVSRCFPNTFFAEVASEDLNCSLVFRPRQQVRPKKSIDVQRRTLRAPDPHPAHRHPRGLELATHIPFSASASSPRCRLGSRLPMSGQFGCHGGKARTAHRGAHLRKPRRKNAHPSHGASARDSLWIYQDAGMSMTGAHSLRPAGRWMTIAIPFAPLETVGISGHTQTVLQGPQLLTTLIA
ncbi:hypothetical protein SAMN05216414_12156 [Nitrosovibrio sp. Nv17]|nr:hypothetical protein SAMN05216414_12156 [Nitrosovibrio sp. Nv17]